VEDVLEGFGVRDEEVGFLQRASHSDNVAILFKPFEIDLSWRRGGEHSRCQTNLNINLLFPLPLVQELSNFLPMN
jgi:hypothetical protein